jgi:ABC-type hemin transport system substrate-binding protein
VIASHAPSGVLKIEPTLRAGRALAVPNEEILYQLFAASVPDVTRVPFTAL